MRETMFQSCILHLEYLTKALHGRLGDSEVVIEGS